MPYASEVLAPPHMLDAFDSGAADLDRWLRDSARNAHASGTARTFVWRDEGSDEVVGYFSLAPHVVQRDETSTRVGRGSPDAIPAILLARLALDRRLHGIGLGSQLLIDALERIVGAARGVGGRLVIVDAIDASAETFYCHHGFEPMKGRTDRLVQKLSRVAATLELEWP